MENVNLDHMSSNPVLPEVQEAMIEAIKKNYGNPSSMSTAGEEAAEVLLESREKVARLINAKDIKEIIFTSGGTESVNHAIKGACLAHSKKGNHIVTTNIEHSSVTRSLKRLGQMGYRVTSVPVDKKGRVNPEDIRKAITDDTILVSVMHSNNEIGTIQPIAEISEITREKKILLHTDAVCSVGLIPVDVQKLGIDLLSFSAATFNGPPGVGGLYIRKGVSIWPILDGGIQERNKRAGTENLIGIIGMGVAADHALTFMEERTAHLGKLREHLLSELSGNIDEYYINGDPENTLPNIVSASIQYIEGESIVLMLEDQGYSTATRSACATGSLRASHVLLSVDLSHSDAQGTLVITTGFENTFEEISGFTTELSKIVKTLRDISPLYQNKTE